MVKNATNSASTCFKPFWITNFTFFALFEHNSYVKAQKGPKKGKKCAKNA